MRTPAAKSSTSRTAVVRTNVRRVRKWKKRRNWAPYFFLLGVILFGLALAFYYWIHL